MEKHPLSVNTQVSIWCDSNPGTEHEILVTNVVPNRCVNDFCHPCRGIRFCSSYRTSSPVLTDFVSQREDSMPDKLPTCDSEGIFLYFPFFFWLIISCGFRGHFPFFVSLNYFFFWKFICKVFAFCFVVQWFWCGGFSINFVRFQTVLGDNSFF